MEKFILEPSSHTPYVFMDPKTGLFEFKGRSTPENSIEFYDPIYKFLDNYILAPNSKTIVNVSLEYFNTSSSKCILDVFKKFAKLHKDGKNVLVNWYYEEEDDDMREKGEDYSDILNLPFHILLLNE
jgi:hypothetical protein